MRNRIEHRSHSNQCDFAGRAATNSAGPFSLGVLFTFIPWISTVKTLVIFCKCFFVAVSLRRQETNYPTLLRKIAAFKMPAMKRKPAADRHKSRIFTLRLDERLRKQ